jgi:hypothetical protein
LSMSPIVYLYLTFPSSLSFLTFAEFESIFITLKLVLIYCWT